MQFADIPMPSLKELDEYAIYIILKAAAVDRYLYDTIYQIHGSR